MSDREIEKVKVEMKEQSKSVKWNKETEKNNSI